MPEHSTVIGNLAVGIAIALGAVAAAAATAAAAPPPVAPLLCPVAVLCGFTVRLLTRRVMMSIRRGGLVGLAVCRLLAAVAKNIVVVERCAALLQ